MLGLAAIVVLWLIIAVLTAWAWHGDGRTDLRRCPRCWYDLSATDSLTCSECGHAARREAELRRSRVSRGWVRSGVVTMVALLLAGVWLVWPDPWTAKLPRPIVRVMLDVAATPPAAGVGLPRPDAALKSAESAWSRLVWQHQVMIVLDAWADAVLATTGPITDAELARLAPLASEAFELYQETGGLIWRESWVHDASRERLMAMRRGVAGDAARLLRVEWAMSELQYPGGGYSHRTDFARLPDAIIEQALAHPDASVRMYGINAFSRRMHEVVMDRTAPRPIGRETVKAMVEGDPSPAVRKLADDVMTYVEAFLPEP